MGSKFKKDDIVFHVEFLEYASIISEYDTLVELLNNSQYVVMAHKDGVRCVWSEHNLKKIEDPEYEKTWLSTMIKNPNWFY